jgi:hypothetical protein
VNHRAAELREARELAARTPLRPNQAFVKRLHQMTRGQKISERFLKSLQRVQKESGEELMDWMRANEPLALVKIMADVAKTEARRNVEVTHTHNHTVTLTDEQLDARIAAAQKQLAMKGIVMDNVVASQEIVLVRRTEG